MLGFPHETLGQHETLGWARSGGRGGVDEFILGDEGADELSRVEPVVCAATS